LAFEVCVRINRVTPITPTSLVTFALLSINDRALTLAQTHTVVRELAEAVQKRRLPTTTTVALQTPEDVLAPLNALVESGVVTRFAEGTEPVYLIGPEQQLTAAYYRNTIIHFLLNGALVELALLHVIDKLAPTAATAAQPGGALELFWEEALRLRDLFKFDFFFADKDTYRGEIADEMALIDCEWKATLATGVDGARRLLDRALPYTAHGVLRPFVEAYRVAAEVLLLPDSEALVDENALVKRCLQLGKQFHLQRRIHSGEAISKVLFETAFKLARNRGLFEKTDLRARREAFAREVADVARRIDKIETRNARRFQEESHA
jgi:glycerol-3-phosphate O-acyltransferase